MDEITKYIFGSLHDNEVAIKNIHKSLKKQAVNNKWFAIIAVATVAYLYANEIRRNEQDKKIAELSVELEELKQKKGEI